jgi:hypothetical protein
MKRQIVECDCCGEQSDYTLSFEMAIGREPDPSGNGYITQWDNKDYCHDCLRKFLKTCIESGIIRSDLKFLVPTQPASPPQPARVTPTLQELIEKGKKRVPEEERGPEIC